MDINTIYNNLVNGFYNKSKIDIAKGSVIDMFMSTIADLLYNIYEAIERNKKPYLFTTQQGEELDNTGAFVGCPRLDNEPDDNYLYRLMAWNLNNASCNATSIDNKCKELIHSKSATYIAHTKGIGTGTIYLTPISYSEEDIRLAINEAVEKVSVKINPSSRVEFKVPEPINIKLVAYLDTNESIDRDSVKLQIIEKVEDYINSIAPGSYMYLGEINKIGLAIEGVEYFNIVQVYANDEESTDFEILQTTIAKFLFDEIIWWDVES